MPSSAVILKTGSVHRIPKFFQHIYDKRCKLVHDGVAPTRILSLVNTTAEFAGDLIEASIDHGQLPSSGEGRG